MDRNHLIAFSQNRTKKFRAKLLKCRSVLASLMSRGSWRNVAPCDVLLVCHDVDRGMTLDGIAYSPLLDSLGERLEATGLRCARLAAPYSALIHRAAFGNPVSINCEFLLRAGFRKLTNAFSVDNNFLLPKTAYSRVIRQCGCRAIIAIEASQDLYVAAHELNIVVCEMMHGIGYPNIHMKYAKYGRNQMPDTFLSLDRVTSESLKKIMNDDQRILEIEHPWLSRFDDRHGRAAVPSEWRLSESVLNRLRGFKKVILLTLQWGYDGEDPIFSGIIPNGILHEGIMDAIKATQGEIFWFCRLHPVQLRDARYEHHRKYLAAIEAQLPNISVSDATHIPLPSLLSECDGHITMMSMACYEAAWMRVPSLLLCPTTQQGGFNEEYFEDLRLAGFVMKERLDCGAIIAWLHQVKKKSEPFARFENGLDAAIESIAAGCRGEMRTNKITPSTV